MLFFQCLFVFFGDLAFVVPSLGFSVLSSHPDAQLRHSFDP